MMLTTFFKPNPRKISPSQRKDFEMKFFNLFFDGEEFFVKIWVNSNEIFVDYEITTKTNRILNPNNEDDFDLIEALLEFIDKNWEKFRNN